MTQPRLHSPRRLATLWPGLIVLAVALSLRVFGVVYGAFGADETQTLQERSWADLWEGAEAVFNPPAWRLLVFAALSWSDSLTLLRVFSAIFGALGCGLLTWGLMRGRPLRPSRSEMRSSSATLAGLGLALTPWLIREQAQARAYGLTLLVGVAILLSLRTLTQRGGRGPHLRAALSVVAGAWTHYTLLPWVGVWWLLTAWRLREAGAGLHGERARLERLRTLWREAGPGLLIGLAGLIWPIRQAIGGWWLKRGQASASMVSVEEMWDPASRPEVWLVGLAVAGLLWALLDRDQRESSEQRRQALGDLLLGLAGIAIALALWWSAGETRTVRWIHLVSAAPALWLAAAATTQRLPLRIARLILSLGLGVLAWGSISLLGILVSGHGRADDEALARWTQSSKVQHIAAWTGSRRGELRPVTHGLLQSLGGYARGERRCTGPDRVHLRRCRERALRISGTRCRGQCLDGRCLWPLKGGAETLEPARGRDPVPCTPGLLSARLSITQALLLPQSERRRRMNAAGLARLLDLPTEVTRSATLARERRWLLLVPSTEGP